jgi:hypothetical protein
MSEYDEIELEIDECGYHRLSKKSIPKRSESEDSCWEVLKVNPNYKIMKSFPYIIRENDYLKWGVIPEKGYYVQDTVGINGYPIISLDRKLHYMHKIIAVQFLENPNKHKEVDHIDKNKLNYRVENLRWVSHSENGKNRKSNKGIVYEYFDELPEFCRPFLHYYGHEFESYLISNASRNMYLWNGVKYRKLILLENTKKYRYYNLQDIFGKTVKVFLSQLIEFY